MDTTDAVVALISVSLGALWTSGGRGALQRRVIEHELDLAAKLDDPTLSSALRSRAEERATIYVARGLVSDASARALWLVMGPLTAGLLVFSIPDIFGLADSTNALTLLARLLGMILVGVSLGAMIDSVLRDGRAWLGKQRVRQAQRRVADLKQSGSTENPPTDVH